MKDLYYSSYGSDQDIYPHMLEILERTKPLGVGVELAIYTEKSPRPQHIPNLLKVVDQFKPYKTLFHGPFMELEATSEPDSEAARYMLDSYRIAFDLCKRFHAPEIVMHTNQRSYEDAEQVHLQGNSIDMILKIGEMAGEAHIALTVENVGFNYKHSVLFPEDDFMELFDKLPEDIGCLIDIGHAILNDWDIPRVIEKLGSRIKSYHIHNNAGDADTHLPLFYENMKYSKKDIVDLFRVMERCTPDANWILEYSPDPHITADLMEADFTEVRTILRQINS